MNGTASNRYSRIAALAILGFVLYLAWMLLARPYLGLWDERVHEIEILQRKHAALQTIIANGDSYRQQYRVISESESLRAVFLDEKPGALADARLQRIVREIISRSGGQPVQVTIDRNVSAGADRRNGGGADDGSIRVRVLMQGSIESIYSALHQLENSRPLILVSNLAISQGNMRYQVTGTRDNTFYRASYDATAFTL